MMANCKHCNAEFKKLTTAVVKKFCTPECKYKWRNAYTKAERLKNPPIARCKWCDVQVDHCNIHYCSDRCKETATAEAEAAKARSREKLARWEEVQRIQDHIDAKYKRSPLPLAATLAEAEAREME